MFHAPISTIVLVLYCRSDIFNNLVDTKECNHSVVESTELRCDEYTKKSIGCRSDIMNNLVDTKECNHSVVESTELRCDEYTKKSIGCRSDIMNNLADTKSCNHSVGLRCDAVESKQGSDRV